MESPARIVADLEKDLEQWHNLNISTSELADTVGLAALRLRKFLSDEVVYLARVLANDGSS
jgi:hypothetical protein